MLMKQNHLLATMKTCLLFSAGVLLMSCAQDGFDDESFNGTYPGFQMTNPDASTITVKASSDKQSQTISWDAVEGAGTYTVSVYQGDAEDQCTNVIVENRVTKVNYTTVPRIDKTYYRIVITVNDNIPEQNTAPEGSVEFKWNTFTIDLGIIPAGTDLYTYFKENPIPVAYQGSDITYTLEDGGQYTISDTVDVDGFMFNLITAEGATNRAKVTFVKNSEETKPHVGFCVGGGLGLKNVDFDCTDLNGPFILLSKNPVETSIPVNAWNTDYNFYLVEEPISIISCNISELPSFFLTDASFGDHGVWFVSTILIDDCVVSLNTDTESTNNAYFYINAGGGFCKDMTVRNSTFYDISDKAFRYFVRYGGFGLSNTDIYGWEDAALTYQNCTFYNVCQNDGQWGNYNGIYRATNVQWTMTNCIFWNCSTSGSVPRRFLHGRGDRGEKAVFLNNTYMSKDGTFQDPQNYDTSGTNIEEDPRFADPANADFHISGSKQAELRTGDPRWLP